MSSNKLIIPFRSYFILKDFVGLIALIILLFTNIAFSPRYFLDCENSVRARPLVTPVHIVPEWYFLYAYCILKRFERKVVGVIILLLRVIFFPTLSSKLNRMNGVKHKFIIVV